MKNLSNSTKEYIDYIKSLECDFIPKILEMSSYVFLTRFERVKLSIKILLSVFK